MRKDLAILPVSIDLGPAKLVERIAGVFSCTMWTMTWVEELRGTKIF